MLAVLREDGHGDLGVVLRREGDEPAVVAQLLGKEVPLLRLLLADDLDRARLAAHVDARDARAVRGPAGLVHDAPEAVEDDVAREARPRDGLLHGGPVDEALARAHVLADVEEVGRREGAVRVRDPADAARELERRDEDRSLPDRDGDRLARVPGVLPHGDAPLRRGHDAPFLVREVDAARAAEAEVLSRLRDRVDSEALAHRVEVRVTGDLEGRREVDAPVLAVAAERTAVEGEAAGTEDALLRVDPVLEDRVRHERLPRRARRVEVLQDAVVEGTVRVREDLVPLGARHAAREQVRVVGRRRDEREDLARLRVERDGGADLAGEEVLREVLEPRVDRELERVARHRVDVARLADLAAEGVDHVRARARDAREEVLV